MTKEDVVPELKQTQTWMDDLDDKDFKEKHSDLLSSIELYDQLCHDLIEHKKSSMSDLDHCLTRMIQRHVSFEFKKDVEQVCRENFQKWAFSNFRRNDPVNFYLKAQRAYRLAVLHFMPRTFGWLQDHPLVLAKTVQY